MITTLDRCKARAVMAGVSDWVWAMVRFYDDGRVSVYPEKVVSRQFVVGGLVMVFVLGAIFALCVERMF